jgi:hypothetical protein
MRLFVSFVIIVSLLHVLHNNLLINVLFWCRLKNVSCCKPVWECSKCLTLNCATRRFCTDNFSHSAVKVKWIMFLIFWIVALNLNLLCMHTCEECGSTMECSARTIPNIAFAVLHPVIFYIIRIPIFLLYVLCSCGLDKSERLPEDYEFDKEIISLEYIEKSEMDLTLFGVDESVLRNPFQER